MTTNSKNDLSNIIIDEEDNSINSSFLKRDYSYKMNHNYDKSIIKRSKPTLKCVVCGDNAFGYNFDAIACESCKAFFRRTALRLPGKLKCGSNGHCEVTIDNRKRCKKCRLDKCFKMGMRKEWILTNEEKQKKRSLIAENRRRKQKYEDTEDNIKHVRFIINQSYSTSSFKIDDILSMTASDWSRIHQVQCAYSESIKLNQVVGVPSFPATQPIHSTVELIRIPTYLASIRLITFLKKIPEFNLFHLDDRVTLVKYNLLAVVFMHIVLIYDSKYDTYHEYNTEDPIFEGKDWIKILGEEFYQELTYVTIKLIKIIKNDHIIIKIFLLLILFTKGFCSYDIVHEPTLKNYSIVFQTQNSYLESLYKYCLYNYGLTKTLTIFITLLQHLFSVQRLAVHLKDYVHNHIDVSQISPLMQSVLQLNDSISSV